MAPHARKLSSGVTSDFVRRRCVLEIYDSCQVTLSTNNFAGFTDTHVVPKYAWVYDYMCETSKSPAVMADYSSC